MSEDSNPKVPFMTEEMNECICPQCPVQGNSQCVKDKMERLSGIMKTRNGKIPESRDVPSLYCSSGTSSCQDIDIKQMCICGGCPVWQEYNLISGEPTHYFCKNGRAR